MRAHKYIKRTGSKGSYRYWYRLPDGRVVASDDASSPVSHDKAKIEHVKRLIAAKIHGHHNMSIDKMAAHVGVGKNQVTNAVSNLSRAARQHMAKPEEQRRGAHFGAEHGHDFEHDQMKEAVHEDVNTPEYGRHSSREVPAAEAERRSAPTAPETPTPRAMPPSEPGHELARSRGFRAGRGTGNYTRYVTHGSHEIQKVGNKYKLTSRHAHEGVQDTMHDTLEDAVNQSSAREAAHQQRDAERMAREDAENRQQTAPAAAPAAPAAPAEESKEEKIRKLREKLAREHGVNLGAPAAPAPAAAPAAAPENVTPIQPAAEARATAVRAAARAASSPRSEGANALHQASPDLAVADQPIARMEEVAERGGNPYFERAKEIYHNIVGDLKPERKQTIDHIMNSLNNLKMRGEEWNEANLVEEYKRLSGKRIRGISGIAEEFEKGTFMTLDEILKNEPLDAEVERMKRGYAAKQFARMRPFLKDSWTAANPSAPPPYPTFGDIKSWTEHGGPKPSWAGSTRLAMPQEVFEAAAKKDGKPQYPPAWMPIHMMPAWNYIVKKAGSEGNPYQTVNPMGQGGRLNAGTQARYQEGIAINALRKYVQMRGGPNQLVDIPKGKLAEVGLTHSDIFKAFDDNDLSDATLKRLLKHKIVDSVALKPFLDEAMAEQKPIKKSFSLVVSEDAKPVVFKKSFTIDVEKAEIIKKIKELKAKR